MEQDKESRWYGNEHWFKFDHHAGLRRFKEISSLGETSSAIALRALKFRLEEELGFEISDALFIDVFRTVCNFHPVPALGCYAVLAFIQPIQRIFERHGIQGDSRLFVGPVWCTFRVRVDTNRTYKHILLHIPHSSVQFPEDVRYTFMDLDAEEMLLIDYYTDELFMPDEERGRIHSVDFPYCRLFCDVERLINDPLEKNGLGISYSRWIPSASGYGQTYRTFGAKEQAFKLYADYHARVKKKIVELGSDVLLIDCHSFSSQPNLLCSNPPDIDICIGFNDDDTCPNKVVIGNIEQYFLSRGYKVGINKPFSNSKTFKVPVKYHSVMIEVNKRLYMDEQTLEKTERFDYLKLDILSLYSILLNE